jgi:hypothetical protein
MRFLHRLRRLLRRRPLSDGWTDDIGPDDLAG